MIGCFVGKTKKGAASHNFAGDRIMLQVGYPHPHLIYRSHEAATWLVALVVDSATIRVL